MKFIRDKVGDLADGVIVGVLGVGWANVPVVLMFVTDLGQHYVS